jgi:hypothetical protein
LLSSGGALNCEHTLDNSTTHQLPLANAYLADSYGSNPQETQAPGAISLLKGMLALDNMFTIR